MIHVFRFNIDPITINFAKYIGWRPIYPVSFQTLEGYKDEEVLIDSGADVSIVSHALGKQMGYSANDKELPMEGFGISGSFDFYLRKAEIKINEHEFEIPVLWVMEQDIKSLIGRHTVFDHFDIEFRQRDKEIVFKRRLV